MPHHQRPRSENAGSPPFLQRTFGTGVLSLQRAETAQIFGTTVVPVSATRKATGRYAECRCRYVNRTTSPLIPSQKLAQASMRLRRLSSASLRRYARSTASPTRCANAASATSRAKVVRSPTQSRKALRNPCTVASTCDRRSTISSAMLERGLAELFPEKTKSAVRKFSIVLSISIVRSESRTRCDRMPFIRSAGTVRSCPQG